jgi:acetylglutamate kinase
MRILKIGGNELNDAAFMAALGEAVANLVARQPVVIVHGGGRSIGELHTALGLPTMKVDGLRITSERSLHLAEMVLSGEANKQVVRTLLAAGVDAIGISGIDGALIHARKKRHPTTDLGFVGEVTAVRAEMVRRLLAQEWTPVISPISLGTDGHAYNVNADDAATAIAAALHADQLDFISNVPGVLHEESVLSALSVAEAEGLIAAEVVYGGMIPKVRAALDAIAQGVARTRIVNLAGLADDQAGTIFS